MSGDSVDFKTLSGTLTALINESTIELDFPSPVIECDVPQSQELLDNLGLEESNVRFFGGFETKVFIEVDSEETLLNIQPNFEP